MTIHQRLGRRKIDMPRPLWRTLTSFPGTACSDMLPAHLNDAIRGVQHWARQSRYADRVAVLALCNYASWHRSLAINRVLDIGAKRRQLLQELIS